MLLKNNVIDKAYPRYALVISINWLMFTNIPFLGKIRSYFIFLQILLIIPFLFRKTNITDTIRMNIPLCLFMLMAMITSIFTKSFFNYYLWITLLTVFTAFEFISTADKDEIEKLFSNMNIGLEILLILSFIGILLFKLTDLENSPNYIISYSMGNFYHAERFFGVFNSCNLLGPLAAFAILFTIFNIKKDKNDKLHLTIDILLLPMNIYLLMGSKSLTAIAALCFSLIVMALCHVKKHRPQIFIAIVVLGIIILAIAILNIDFLSNVLHKDLKTATSRTYIWESCFEILKEHPIKGYGSNENYVNAFISNDLYADSNGTHNMYIEVATLYGYPALITYLATLLITITRMLIYYLKGYEIKNEHILLPFLLVIFCMIHGLGEAQLLFANSPIMILFIISMTITNFNLKKFLENS